MEKLSVEKQGEIKKMASERIKKLLLKAGFEEKQLADMSRDQMMQALADIWVQEGEEQGAIGGEIEKPIEIPPAMMSMEMFMQWMMMTKQEEKEKEEKRMQEIERIRKEEKQEEKEKEEKRMQEAERIRKEEKEEAERIRKEEKEKEEKRMQEAERIRKEEKEREEKAEKARKDELELQRQQFQIQLEQLRKDREDAEKRRLEQMIEFEKARKSEEEVRQKQIEDKRIREEEKEKLRIAELEQVEQARQEELKLQEVEKQERTELEKLRVSLKEAQYKELIEEREDRKKQMELLQRKMEQDQERMIAKQEEEEKRKRGESGSLIVKIKKIGDAMKHVLPKMPNDMMEIPLYFETVENAFHSFDVERGYWVKLLLPLMTPKARTVLNRLSYAQLDNYEQVKQLLLREFKLTPREYRARFIDAKKTVDETYTMFSARLKNLLNYYVRSRRVERNFEKLFDLLVADKLKESLPPGPLQFVLSKEGTECFEASVVADLADIHVNNRIGLAFAAKSNFGNQNIGFTDKDSFPYQNGKWKTNQSNQYKGKDVQGRSFVPYENREQIGQQQMFNRSSPNFVRKNNNTVYTDYKKREGNDQREYKVTPGTVKRCHNCGSDKHLVKFCSVPVTTSNYNKQTENTRVNQIQVMSGTNGNDQNIGLEQQETEVKSVMKCGLEKEVLLDNQIQTESVIKSDNQTLRKSLLQYVNVELRGKNGSNSVKINALIDSGTEVPVISEELLEGMEMEEMGKVNLQCVAGDAIPAKLVKIDVRLCGNNENEAKHLQTLTPYISLICASVANMGSKERFLLHPEIIEELKAVPQIQIQANVMTRAQCQRKEKLVNESENETESSSEDETERNDLQNVWKDGVTSEMNKQEMAA